MMTAATGIDPKHVRPLIVTASVWWGYIFSGMYFLYGAVSIILSILDRQYGDLGKPVSILLLGGILFAVARAFHLKKGLGWYGLVVLNGAVVILALFGLNQREHIFEHCVLLTLSIVALVMLFAPTTKDHVFHGR